MWGWKSTFWEALLLWVIVIVSSIACFPCFLLQKLGFKAKMYSWFLCNTSLEDLSYFAIKMYRR